ncbi:hypothetical protein OESDEN_02731 [Oesophagostomum dentatum]|uniref:Calcineurin-like phosphoesterase domain-containing protein n=1 Tax=Oesophagostomum dentatum TaxID=61180 RepID=A0A0B1TN85_OESDE|nr:hypothetical protein OESDEN_02731 [Oesophagostomum dentatum]
MAYMYFDDKFGTLRLDLVPYMVIAGNHEDDGKNFTDYQERFWMPHNGYGDNQFYSFDLGPVHWIGVSTEYYGYYYLYGEAPVLTQYAWLKNDLAIRTGWLDMPGLEPLYLQQGMDLSFWGHEHSYERFYPIADKQFWNDGCHTPYAQFADPAWPFSAARVNDYGYTILTVQNSTHLHLEQISIEKGETAVDDIWIVKDPAHVHSEALSTRELYNLIEIKDSENNGRA